MLNGTGSIMTKKLINVNNWSERLNESRFSARDCWPWTITEELTRNQESGWQIYKRAASIFILDHPDYDLAGRSWNLIEPYWSKMLAVKRWSDYRQADIGDMNVAAHTLRQMGITGQALEFDGKISHISDFEKSLMLSASLTHDLGEIVVSDSTYDLKNQNRLELELAEASAVKNMLFTDQDANNDLKKIYQAYLKISTNLSEEKIQLLNPDCPEFDRPINWPELRSLFHLYERYGYLITAIQTYPLSKLNSKFLSDDFKAKLVKFNRADLVRMDENNEYAGDSFKKAILVKNVLLNQWPHLLDADKKGMVSFRLFFNNPISRKVLVESNDLMQLNLDLTILQ